MDTSRILKTLWSVGHDLSELVWQEDESCDKLMQWIIEQIAFEKRAEIELSYACMEWVQYLLGTGFENRATEVAQTLYRIGKAVYEQLQLLRAYNNGYLFYQFSGFVGRDTILEYCSHDRDPAKNIPPL